MKYTNGMIIHLLQAGRRQEIDFSGKQGCLHVLQFDIDMNGIAAFSEADMM
ncbi:hypothetical protein MTO98_26095 [Mucilaginibacter sp. SMC90]|uniref:hypothetical protein n=1 Tax=Mucilaginibacter sp. SMC90 TaxID=2929803 RepID=UPI001FB211B0|nr:hypothetical protein [Mucilaginibacter sp. SMC90]UOE47886.1 hypothetical protein MTO98_26095 [Mucilaginibacter sp. SMC90]